MSDENHNLFYFYYYMINTKTPLKDNTSKPTIS